MKKLILLMLSALLLFCGCAEEAENNRTELETAVEAVNSAEKISAEYMLELTFGDRTALYYIDGTADWDRSNFSLAKSFSRTYLGNTAEIKHYFADGVLTVEEKGTAFETELDSETLFSQFPCFSVPGDDNIADVTESGNIYGTAYNFTRSDSKEILESLVGGDIYSLVPNIRDPQYDKTQYGDTVCTYTVSDGRMVSCRFELDVKLFDAQPEGENVSEAEYVLDVHVSAKIHYGDFGDGVTVEKYSSPDEE